MRTLPAHCQTRQSSTRHQQHHVKHCDQASLRLEFDGGLLMLLLFHSLESWWICQVTKQVLIWQKCFHISLVLFVRNFSCNPVQDDPDHVQLFYWVFDKIEGKWSSIYNKTFIISSYLNSHKKSLLGLMTISHQTKQESWQTSCGHGRSAEKEVQMV